MYASDSSSALSEDVGVWHAAQRVHEGNGVRIELAIRGDLESIKIFDSPEMENRFVQMLSCRLALKLKSSMSFPVASKCIEDALVLYEKKVKRIKEEAFFNRPLLKPYISSSKLQIPAIRLNLNPNLFLRLRYLSETILKRFILPITCSFKTRWLDNILLRALSSGVNGLFLLFFLGIEVFSWIFFIPR